MELSRKEIYKNQKISLAVTLLSFVVMLLFFIFSHISTSVSSVKDRTFAEVTIGPANSSDYSSIANVAATSFIEPKQEQESLAKETSVTAEEEIVSLKNIASNIADNFETPALKNNNPANPLSENSATGNAKESVSIIGEQTTGNPVMGFDLTQRTILSAPHFTGDTKEEGKVVVDIVVDKNGTVIEADPNGRGTTTSSSILKKEAKKLALAARFSEQQKFEEQRGTITINFSFN